MRVLQEHELKVQQLQQELSQQSAHMSAMQSSTLQQLSSVRQDLALTDAAHNTAAQVNAGASGMTIPASPHDHAFPHDHMSTSGSLLRAETHQICCHLTVITFCF